MRIAVLGVKLHAGRIPAADDDLQGTAKFHGLNMKLRLRMLRHAGKLRLTRERGDFGMTITISTSRNTAAAQKRHDSPLTSQRTV